MVGAVMHNCGTLRWDHCASYAPIIEASASEPRHCTGLKRHQRMDVVITWMSLEGGEPGESMHAIIYVHSNSLVRQYSIALVAWYHP